MTTRQKQLIENYIRLKVKKMMNEKKKLKEESSEDVTTVLLEMLKAFDAGAKKIRHSNSKITNRLTNIRAELYKLYLASDGSADF